jgi:hypothetical protein
MGVSPTFGRFPSLPSRVIPLPHIRPLTPLPRSPPLRLASGCISQPKLKETFKMTANQSLPFFEYRAAVEKLLEKLYGITINDVDEKSVQKAYQHGESPDEYVQWIAAKFDLVRIKPIKKEYPIHQLNDLFRETFIGGRVILTQGITFLSDEDREEVITKVRAFDDFSEDNDPYGEHDFGAIEHKGDKIFWKIDYYDPTMTQGSEDPADPTKTRRVLTIMFANEY